MRAAVFTLSTVAFLLSGAASAQISSPPFYVNREARFAIIFPGEPQARDITYTTNAGTAIPARQFSLDQDNSQHSVTVVEFTTGDAVDHQAVEHAAEQLRRKGEVRFQAAEDYDPGLPGRQLNIFQSDGRQVRASIYMWDHRLYITEASGVPGTQSVLQFEQSITLLEADGSELNIDADRFRR